MGSASLFVVHLLRAWRLARIWHVTVFDDSSRSQNTPTNLTTPTSLKRVLRGRHISKVSATLSES